MAIILYSSCFLLGGAGAWAINEVALKWGLIDSPNRRSSHDRPTPKGGGIGILAGFVFASISIGSSPGFWMPAVLLALFSFLGDKIEIAPKIRLALQFIAAGIFVELSTQSLESSVLLFSFFVAFIVATANWYNFMDGINGIAGISGLVGFCLLAAFSVFLESDIILVDLSLCLALSCLGFLPFNMPRAKVFMGDVGSILLGFVFASMIIILSKSFLDFLCLSAVLFPFYADELTTMAVRIKDRQNLLKPHRRHIYQLLANERGIAHWKVSVGYGLFQLAVGLSVLWVRPFGLFPVLCLLAVYFLGFTLFGCAVRRGVAALKRA